MKRKLPWILVAAVLLCAVVVMLQPTKPVVRPRITLSFLSFSNAATGPEVVFAVHFPKGYGGSSWKYMEMDRWEEGKWKPWVPVGGRLPGMQLQAGSPQGTLDSNGLRTDLLASYALPNTNDTWFIRTHVEEDPPVSAGGWFRFFGRNRRAVNSRTTNASLKLSYWMTNVVGSATTVP